MNADPSRAWAVVDFVRTTPWAYPWLEVLHILGLALVFGTLWLVELRLLGIVRRPDTAALAREALPWTLAGFVLSAVTGLALFASRAGELLVNPAFQLKLALIALAGLNAALLHSRGPLDASRPGTRVQAALSLLLWAAVIAAGRWIAYV